MPLESELIEVLPQWLGFSRLLIGLPTAFAASFAGTWFGAWLVQPPLQSLRDMHWAERARAVHPARCVTGFFILFAPIFFAQFLCATRGALDGLPSGVVGGLAAIASLGGATLASRSMHCRVTGDSVSWARYTRHQVVTLVLLAPHVLILFFMLATIEGELDRVSLACAVVSCVGLLLVALCSGLPLVRLFGAVHPASSRLASLADELGRQTGVAPRSIEEVDLGMANAWALPAAQRLVFTRALSSALDDEELRGIIAHEMGHLNDPMCARVVGLGVLAFVPLGFIRPAIFHLGTPGLVGVFVCFMAMLTLATRLGRHGEKHADAAVSAVDVEAADYASALEIIHRENLTPAVMSSGASHPSLYDRMLSAGVEPDFPRPLPPSSVRTWVGSAAAAAGVLLVVCVIYLAPVFISEFDTDVERKALFQIAWSGASAKPLFSLAREQMAEGRDVEAMVLVEASLERNPGNHAYLATRADLLGRKGRCDAASGELAAAIDSASVEHREQCRWIERAGDSVADCQLAIVNR